MKKTVTGALPSDTRSHDGRLIGYARVSRPDQILQTQIDGLIKGGVPERNIYAEKVSGVSAKRPQLELALMHLERGDTLVIYKLDRLGRSLMHLLEIMQDLAERGIGFRSLGDSFDTTTAVGKVMLHILAAFAQFERDLIGERTRDALAAKRARGAIKDKIDARKALAMLQKGTSPAMVAQHFGVTRAAVYKRFGGAELIAGLPLWNKREFKPKKR